MRRHDWSDVARVLEERSYPEPNSGCVLWTGATMGMGYGAVRTPDGKRGAHQVAWQLAKGPIPDGMCVLHKCDVPECINPDHLFLGTKAENNRDRMVKGRNNSCRAEKHGRAKLTWEAVREIRGQLKSGASGKGLAKKYNVDPSVVYDIGHGKIWKEAPSEEDC